MGGRGEPWEQGTNGKLQVPGVLLRPEGRLLAGHRGVAGLQPTSSPCCPSLKETSPHNGGRFPVATYILFGAIPYRGPLVALFCAGTAVFCSSGFLDTLFLGCGSYA